MVRFKFIIMSNTLNQNVKQFQQLLSPQDLRSKVPTTEQIDKLVLESRVAVQNILDHKDDRMLIICGPCSIHDPDAAFEYAEKLAKLRDKVSDKIFLVMRVYFEKPRTTIGWKGLITDPHIDGSDKIEDGLLLARKVLLKIASLGLPAATEFLDPIVPQFTSDLITWAAIGARTTESQTHRMMASGLSMPVGFKNNTTGNKKAAVNAMQSALNSHSFLGVGDDGKISVVTTKGNNYGHIILRGGDGLPNYDEESIKEAGDLLRAGNLNPAIMVDCSHANSGKKFEKQEVAWNSVLKQRASGNKDLIGLMLESNLQEGNQSLPELKAGENTLAKLKYGVSITDACVSFSATEELFDQAMSILP